MSKIRFQGRCPGCGDNHLGIECKKPSVLTPVIAKAICHKCESIVLLRIVLPRQREKSNEISYQYINVRVTETLVAILEERKKQLEQIKPPEVTTPGDIPIPIQESNSSLP